jgi:flagellar protein FliS
MAQLPYQNYNQTKIQTSDQLSLIILLYDGLSRFLRKGQRKIFEKDYEGAHHYLTRSRDIVNELLVTLRVEDGNEVAQNLRSLYVFMIGQIIEANLKKDASMVDEVLAVAQNLRDGWTQLKDQKVQSRQQKNKTFANDEIVRQRRIRLHG